ANAGEGSFPPLPQERERVGVRARAIASRVEGSARLLAFGGRAGAALGGGLGRAFAGLALARAHEPFGAALGVAGALLQAALQRIHQVHHFLVGRRRRLDRLLALFLRLDDLAQRVLVAILELRRIEV